MASSAHKQHHLFPNLHGGATTAPPPTPSTNPTALLSTPDAADALSRLLHRLPPNLSLPTCRSSSSSSSSAAATCPPSITLSDGGDILSSVSQLGFAQLTNHSVSSQLANSAESEALKLFDLPRDKKEALFPKNWPLGYDHEDDDEDNDDEEFKIEHGESFRLDSSCSVNSSSPELALTFLPKFSVALEKLGLDIVDVLMKAMDLENPIEKDPTRFCSVMWISESRPGSKPGFSGGFYPYVVALQYQIRSEKHSLLSDSGWVSVLPHVDSILVTLGDIAQVWSNGKLKKVRGRPVAIVGDNNENDYSRSITMSLLITLPPDSTVAPILPKTISSSSSKEQKEEEDDDGGGGDGDDEQSKIGGEGEDERVFNSFDFEDYAWRVYHERLLFKDPLDRYRRVA